MLSVDVHAANIHDTKSGISTAKEAYMSYPSIQKFCADAGYRGTFVSEKIMNFPSLLQNLWPLFLTYTLC